MSRHAPHAHPTASIAARLARYALPKASVAPPDSPRERILASAAFIDLEELARRWRTTHDKALAMVKRNEVVALPTRAARLRVPEFYADPMLDTEFLKSVSRALAGLPLMERWAFFVTPKDALGRRTPLRATLEGDRKAVFDCARRWLREA